MSITSGIIGTERTRLPFGTFSTPAGEVAPDVEQPADEIDVAPAQRQQLALAQAGERGHPVDRRVLGVVGVGGEQLDLVAVEGVELARVDDLRALDQIGRGRVVG